MRTPDSWDTARTTVAIALGLGFLFIALSVFELTGWAVRWGAFVPGASASDLGFSRAPYFLTPLSASLIHSSLFQIVFNLLILLVCGRAVEGTLGRAGIITLCLIGAYVGALADYLAAPSSMAPLFGAGAATSAVLGAYAMLFGKNKVPVRDPRIALWLNVLWMLAAWIVLQAALVIVSGGGEILSAIAAYVASFAAGVALARPLLLWHYRKA